MNADDALILGVDPGLANTGWALIDRHSQIVACGTIRTRPGPIAPRLLRIVEELRAALAGAAVGEAALEELFMGRNATSAVAVAQARGAVLASLCAAGLPIHEYTPAQVKAVLTGYGAARKQQMMRMVASQVRDGG
ncbi:MAG: crossover junction endodeoxyribonuclease RuvC, partial [Candidatus Dormiibacterota bacterium]